MALSRFVFRYRLLFFYFSLLGAPNIFGQSVPQGFNYQTTVRNNSGSILSFQPVTLNFSFYSNGLTGTIVWQENHFLATDAKGHVKTVIGNGVSTGVGSSSAFNLINWSSGIYYLKVSIDAAGGTTFVDMGATQLFSVPYSLHSLKSQGCNNLSLSELNDVSVTTNSVGNLLKWNGLYWISSLDNDNDTVLYAISTSHSIYTDTANYVYATLMPDTLLFANYTDSALYTTSALSTTDVNLSSYSDTAIYAFSSPPSGWMINGNFFTNPASYFGTNDNSDVNFITSNVLRTKIKSTGSFSVNNSIVNATLSLSGNDGMVVNGNINSSYTPVFGSGSKMLYYPSLGAFRAGYVDSNQWDSANVGKYSMALGFNNKVRFSSFSSGSDNEVVDCSIAIGRKNKAMGIGNYPGGSSVALGDSCWSTSQRSVTIGKNNVGANSDYVIGYNNIANGGISVCIGANCKSAGARTLAMGYYAYAMRVGSFAYADASSTTPLSTTINHQFLVRASGGVVFYTDTLNSMGVVLNPGSGSWSTVSDRTKKENILPVDYEIILNNIDKLKIKSWNYISQPKDIRHIGPMAQDFHALFGIGENNITISTGDIDGVILAGIKAVSARVNKMENLYQFDLLKQRIVEFDNSKLNERLDAIEEAINKN
jgi:hypothetical protein